MAIASVGPDATGSFDFAPAADIDADYEPPFWEDDSLSNNLNPPRFPSHPLDDLAFKYQPVPCCDFTDNCEKIATGLFMAVGIVPIFRPRVPDRFPADQFISSDAALAALALLGTLLAFLPWLAGRERVMRAIFPISDPDVITRFPRQQRHVPMEAIDPTYPNRCPASWGELYCVGSFGKELQMHVLICLRILHMAIPLGRGLKTVSVWHDPMTPCSLLSFLPIISFAIAIAIHWRCLPTGDADVLELLQEARVRRARSRALFLSLVAPYITFSLLSLTRLGAATILSLLTAIHLIAIAYLSSTRNQTNIIRLKRRSCVSRLCVMLFAKLMALRLRCPASVSSAVRRRRASVVSCTAQSAALILAFYLQLTFEDTLEQLL